MIVLSLSDEFINTNSKMVKLKYNFIGTIISNKNNSHQYWINSSWMSFQEKDLVKKRFCSNYS